MKKRWMFVFVICLAAMGAASGTSAEPLAMATGEWTPYTSEHMEGYGFITEIVTETCREMNIDPEYRFYPWRRCYTAVLSGKVWGAFPYSYTEERAGEVLFSEPVGESKTVFFYYKNKKCEFETIADLKPCKLGGVVGYFYEEAFKKADLNVDYAPDETSAVRKLFAGRTDLLPLNELVGWQIIRTEYPDHAKEFGVLKKPYDINELSMIVSKSYPDGESYLKRFNEALAKVKAGDKFKRILIKYGLKAD